MASRRPLLEIRHLQAGGGVHAVGGLEQAGQKQRFEWRARIVVGDGLADRVDSFAVEGLEVARLHTERLGDIAGPAGEVVEPVDGAGELIVIDLSRVGSHIALGQNLRIARGVDRSHGGPLAFELLRYPRRPGEQVERGPGARPTRAPADLTQSRDQPPLRSDVLDRHVLPVRAFAEQLPEVSWDPIAQQRDGRQLGVVRDDDDRDRAAPIRGPRVDDVAGLETAAVRDDARGVYPELRHPLLKDREVLLQVLDAEPLYADEGCLDPYRRSRHRERGETG